MSKQVHLPILFAIVVAGAHASEILSSTTGLSNPNQVLTFSEVVLADNTPLTNQYSTLGVTFANFFYNPCQACAKIPPDGVTPDIGNFFGGVPTTATGPYNTSLSIVFSAPVTGAAFDFSSNFGAFSFTARLGSTVVDQISVIIAANTPNGVDGWGYYGFSNDIFDNIQLTAGAPPSDPSCINCGIFKIDDLQTSVPEPSTVLFGSGALLILALSRRRMASAKN